MNNKYTGLSTAYSIFNILKFVLPVVVLILSYMISEPYWETRIDRSGYAIAINLFGLVFAFIAWLSIIIYQDIIKLFVQLGKDVNEIKKKK